MTFEQIKELVELVAERQLQGLELERSGFRLRIEGQAAKTVAGTVDPTITLASPPAPGSAPAQATAPIAPAPPAAAAAPPASSDHVLTSPIVGTFYRAPNPDSPPFVEVGSRVKKGQVLCIIEAMKLMNEIESDADGVVSRILPQNAQAVEFGEPLFAIAVS